MQFYQVSLKQSELQRIDPALCSLTSVLPPVRTSPSRTAARPPLPLPPAFLLALAVVDPAELSWAGLG